MQLIQNRPLGYVQLQARENWSNTSEDEIQTETEIITSQTTHFNNKKNMKGVIDKGFADLLFRCCTVHILSFSY
jgi:hypothetical protein